MPEPTTTPRVRLLKVVVQPVYVVDDGESIEELTVQPVEIKAGEWDDFASSAFTPQALDQLAQQLQG